MQFFLLLCTLFSLSQPAAAFCEVMIRHYEKQHGMPDKLLQAVAIAESGRALPGKGVVAWPWTINAEGKPFVFDTKIEAVNKVRELQAQGVRSIDVGCMQINLKHHPHAFSSLEEAFEPQNNIAYGAEFLKQKMLDQGNWYNAVAHYHSATPSLNTPYKNRVLQIWDRVRETADSVSEVFTPAPLQQVRRINVAQMRGIGRRIPTTINFSPLGGSIKKINVIKPIGNKSFFHIKQKGEVGKLKQAAHYKAVAVPGNASSSHPLQPQRKFFKLSN